VGGVSVNNSNIVPDGEGLFYFSYLEGKGIQVDVSLFAIIFGVFN
jgi:hypothetical protein